MAENLQTPEERRNPLAISEEIKLHQTRDHVWDKLLAKYGMLVGGAGSLIGILKFLGIAGDLGATGGAGTTIAVGLSGLISVLSVRLHEHASQK